MSAPPPIIEKEQHAEEEEEDISCQGRFLDEYMKNAKVDPTLVVSKADRSCLMVSRGKPSERSTNVYRKQVGEDDNTTSNNKDDDGTLEESTDEYPSSLIVLDPRRGVTSVASDYSTISFSSVISDDDDDDDEKNDAHNMSDASKTTTNATTSHHNQLHRKGIRSLPSSGVVANEWRKKIGIAPIAASNTVTRLERQLSEFIEKELRALKLTKDKELGSKEKDKEQEQRENPTNFQLQIKTTRTTTFNDTTTPSTTTTTTPIPSLATTTDAAHIEENTDARLHIYNQAVKQLILSHEMKPYRFVLNEYIKLSNIKLNRIDTYKIKVDELSSMLGSVERKAQKRLVAIYKHCSVENDRLKQELHASKMNQQKDEHLHQHREGLCKNEIDSLKTSIIAMDNQKDRMTHVHNVLLKYFQKHALWKSTGEDPNMFLHKGGGRGGNNTEENESPELESLQDGDELVLSSVVLESSLLAEGGGKLAIAEEVDEETARLERSLAIADQNQADSAAHEHERAEWKQIHLSMSAMKDSHMAALSELQNLADSHKKQLRGLYLKIEHLEKEKAVLLIQKGPGETPTPPPSKCVSGQSAASAVSASASAPASKKLGAASGRRMSAMSAYPKRSEVERTGYEGLAPIVVEILKRRPLPALDADAVIIKVKKKKSGNGSSLLKSNSRRMPMPPNRQKHLTLHSKSKHSSFNRRAHNPHGDSPRQVSRLSIPVKL